MMSSKGMNQCLNVNGRKIGKGQPTYIIAEMSANHSQNYDEAVAILHAAKGAGADAVKVQTYTPDTITIPCTNKYFRIDEGTIWEGRNLYDLYSEAFTPWEWQPKLKAVADEIGIDFFSTPFDETAVDFLEVLNLPVYKIASFEIVDLPLLRKVARTGKPIIMSTGMASLAEIDEAVQTLKSSGNTELALLKCTSAYPAAPEEMNLLTIPNLQDCFGVITGLSDHTLGIAVPVTAVALGASIIEKHFTLTKNNKSPDSSFSLTPEEFQQMVASIRLAEKALGKISYEVGERELHSRVFRRSLFVVKNIEAGEAFTYDNVRSIRPGHGLHTRNLGNVVGRKATRDIAMGTPLSWNLVG